MPSHFMLDVSDNFTIGERVILKPYVDIGRGLKSTSVKKAPNQTPFFASTAILEKNFLIRSGCLFLNHLDIPLNYI